MVFRLLSSHKNEVERKRLRGYIKQNLGITSEDEIESLFDLANDFKQQSKVIDNNIISIKNRNHPTHSYNQNDLIQLEKLKKDKEKIIGKLIKEIPRRLTVNGRNKLNQNLQERVKSKIKVNS